jgi:hypothetical protein
MILYQESVPRPCLEDLLQEAAERTGFSLSDIVHLMDSELETTHLLEYITAVTSDRMN